MGKAPYQLVLSVQLTGFKWTRCVLFCRLEIFWQLDGCKQTVDLWWGEFWNRFRSYQREGWCLGTARYCKKLHLFFKRSLWSPSPYFFSPHLRSALFFIPFRFCHLLPLLLPLPCSRSPPLPSPPLLSLPSSLLTCLAFVLLFPLSS